MTFSEVIIKRMNGLIETANKNNAWEMEAAAEMMKAVHLLTLVAVPGVAQTPGTSDAFNLRQHLKRQREWSGKVFGPGPRTQGVVDHIRKELCEIEADPLDIMEWIDVVILALDGAWRAGAYPDQIISALVAKQTKNEGRSWPDWRTADPNKAIEHVKGASK